jgi:hypothetical protein
MIKSLPINEPKPFYPVSFTVTIDNKEDLDLFTSLTNNACIVKEFPNLIQLKQTLQMLGGDQNKYLNRFSRELK